MSGIKFQYMSFGRIQTFSLEFCGLVRQFGKSHSCLRKAGFTRAWLCCSWCRGSELLLSEAWTPILGFLLGMLCPLFSGKERERVAQLAQLLFNYSGDAPKLRWSVNLSSKLWHYFFQFWSSSCLLSEQITKMTMVDTLVHPSNKPVDLVLPATSISTFYKMGGLFLHSTPWKR